MTIDGLSDKESFISDPWSQLYQLMQLSAQQLQWKIGKLFHFEGSELRYTASCFLFAVIFIGCLVRDLLTIHYSRLQIALYTFQVLFCCPYILTHKPTIFGLIVLFKLWGSAYTRVMPHSQSQHDGHWSALLSVCVCRTRRGPLLGY